MRQTRARKITVKSRLDAAIEAIPEADRTERIRAALQGLGGTLHVTATVPCPVCGHKTLPAEYSHGIKRCHNCCYFNQQTFSAERIAETIADSLSWMRAHGREEKCALWDEGVYDECEPGCGLVSRENRRV